MGKTESDVMLLGTVWMSIEKLGFLAFGKLPSSRLW
jgi:hypothetical protein